MFLGQYGIGFLKIFLSTTGPCILFNPFFPLITATGPPIWFNPIFRLTTTGPFIWFYPKFLHETPPI
jgi:hypothetical protein